MNKWIQFALLVFININVYAGSINLCDNIQGNWSGIWKSKSGFYVCLYDIEALGTIDSEGNFQFQMTEQPGAGKHCRKTTFSYVIRGLCKDSIITFNNYSGGFSRENLITIETGLPDDSGWIAKDNKQLLR